MKYCPECNAPVYCASGTNKDGRFSSLSPVAPVDDTKSCLCRELIKKIKTEIELNIREYKAGRLENIVSLNLTAHLVEGIDFYMENSFRVMTEWYHLKRGYCCKNGCRHCPYGFKIQTV